MLCNQSARDITSDYLEQGLPLPVDVLAHLDSEGMLLSNAYTSEETVDPSDFQMEI